MEQDRRRRSIHIVPGVVAGVLICLSVFSRSATSILTPIWLDTRNNHTGNDSSSCDFRQSENQIDAYTIIFIANLFATVLFGFILLVSKCFCQNLITERETKYDKREFVLIGVSDTVSAICFVYASSGCRTAPYLQSIAANFAIPVTFIIRFLILHKRPTCRKTLCALLVLFAEFTALVPDIFPGLETEKARKDEGGASGLAGLLWPLCFFFGFIPNALISIIIEKSVKSSSPTRHRQRDDNAEINIAYVLFWCYLSSLLTHVLLFWTDIVPGFGMADNLKDFAEGFWFNVKCFFGYEGCRGMINVVSSACLVLLFVNRVANSYFLRYLEGANYLAIISSIQTPVVFIFFTLFDENPVRWHPHAYLSTWLSVAALCIMIPAIYIYDTGDPEHIPHQPEPIQFNIDDGVQTDPMPPEDTDENTRLLDDTDDIQNNNETDRLQYDPPAYLIDFGPENIQLNADMTGDMGRQREPDRGESPRATWDADETTRLLCHTDNLQNNNSGEISRLQYDLPPPPYLINFEAENIQLNAVMETDRETQSNQDKTESSAPTMHNTNETSRILHDTDESTRLFTDPDESMRLPTDPEEPTMLPTDPEESTRLPTDPEESTMLLHGTNVPAISVSYGSNHVHINTPPGTTDSLVI